MINEQPGTAGDIRMYLTVLHQAEQATAAERWQEAIPLWEQVAALNPVSGAHWLQLGYAQMYAQQDHAAIASLTRALELGGAFPPPGDDESSFPWRIAYQIACCYARIGEQHYALDWLERALAQGYRARAALADDPAFSMLAHDPRFRMLLGRADTPAGSRDDGWRQDIGWLATEIKRLHQRPFRHISEPAFDELVQQLAHGVPDLSDPQLFVGLMKLMPQLGDGHSRVVIWQERPEFQSVPLIRYWFTEGLFIIAAAPGYDSLLGAQVLRVGELPVAEVLGELDAIISQDNTRWPRLMAPYFLHQPYLLHGLGLAPDPASLQLSIRDATGQMQTVILPAEQAPIHTPYGFSAPEGWSSIPRSAGGEIPLYLRDIKNYWYEQIPKQKALYVQYKRVRDEPDQSFASFCQELFALIDQQPVEKLVIDLAE